MKTIFTFLAFLITLASYSQYNSMIIENNNAAARISDNGYFFSNLNTSNAGYEFPKGGGRHLIYSSSFWMGGTDVNGQRKLAAQQYFDSGQDYWAGPLESNSADAIDPNPFSQTMWAVTKNAVDNHIANFQSQGYVVPLEIENWPAIGDSSQGVSYYMAPFVDVNFDGLYVPTDGDYPCIKGDQAVYMILNDRANLHDSGGEPIGAELRIMFYQFNSVPELNNTTFIDLKVVNKGTQLLYDFHVSYFLDADIGYYADDFFGSDSTRNLMFMYNGDAIDEDGGGVLGYGAVAPALGVLSLNNETSSLGAFTSSDVYPQGSPSTPTEYFNVMRGDLLDGTPWLDNNGDATNYIYPSDPTSGQGWSEYNFANIPGDRRMLMNINAGTLGYQDEKDFSFAVISAQGTDNLNSVTELYQSSDFIQNYYNQMVSECFSGTVGVEEALESTFSISPNPSNGVFTLSIAESVSNYTLAITDMYGRVVSSEQQGGINSVTVIIDEPAGVYFVTLTSGNGALRRRVIIE